MKVIIIGRTGAGKSTLVKKFIELGYIPILEYYTRPPREGEVDGETYHFISNEQFLDMKSKDLFAESIDLYTIYGIWRCGALKSDFEGNDNRVVAMGPVQLKQILDAEIEDVFSIMIDTTVEDILSRTGARGDAREEVERRIREDDPKYEMMRDKVSLVVDGSKTPDEIMAEIRKVAGI